MQKVCKKPIVAFNRHVLVMTAMESDTSPIIKILQDTGATCWTVQDFFVKTKAELEKAKLNFHVIQIYGNAILDMLQNKNDPSNDPSKLLCILAPQGQVEIHDAPFISTDPALQRKLQKFFLYAGFMEKAPSNVDSSLSHLCFVKPNWIKSVSNLYPAAVETIDEQYLVDDQEVYQKLGQDSLSCDQKPRACANCTCGRAELEKNIGEDEAKRLLEQGTVRSSCGSCYLGDAFRCDSCPYRGLPAFRPGEQVKLDLSNDAMGHVQSEENSMFVSDDN